LKTSLRIDRDKDSSSQPKGLTYDWHLDIPAYIIAEIRPQKY